MSGAYKSGGKEQVLNRPGNELCGKKCPPLPAVVSLEKIEYANNMIPNVTHLTDSTTSQWSQGTQMRIVDTKIPNTMDTNKLTQRLLQSVVGRQQGPQQAKRVHYDGARHC